MWNEYSSRTFVFLSLNNETQGDQEESFLEDSQTSWQAKLRGLARAEKLGHFYRCLASCAAKKFFNCFPFSQSHKASQSVPVYTNCGSFFFLFFFCRQLKIIARFRLALKTQPYVFRTVWLWVNIGRKIKDVCGAEGLFVSSWGLSVCYIRCVPVTLA